MSLIIGFATEYYTLWEYTSENVYAGNVVMNGVGPLMIGVKHRYGYIKNISKDIEKTKALYPGIEIDEDLRGQTRSFERFEKVEYPIDQFSFGMASGTPIMESNDVWQLKRACGLNPGHGGELSARRRVLARRRLIQLGELVRYPHMETKSVNVNWGLRDANGNCLPEDYQDVQYRVTYATPRFVEIQESKKRAAEQPYYFNDGEKVTINIKETGRFGFDTQYGYTSVRIYVTDDGKQVKYVGSSPINLPDGFSAIRATIKHKEFRGNKETHLLRMKLAEKPNSQLNESIIQPLSFESILR